MQVRGAVGKAGRQKSNASKRATFKLRLPSIQRYYFRGNTSSLSEVFKERLEGLCPVYCVGHLGICI